MNRIISPATEQNLTDSGTFGALFVRRALIALHRLRVFSYVSCLVVLTALAANAVATPFSETFAFAPANSPRTGRATLLGAVQLATLAPDGESVHGLSGLAWDRDESILYAVSDFGYLVWLRPVIEGGRLTAITFLERHPLRDSNGARLTRPLHDAEGLTVRHANNNRRGDTEIVISFEQRPRIARHSPTGELLGHERLPTQLAKDIEYADPNRGLEAITWHRHYGYLYGPETTVGAGIPGRLSVISNAGTQWEFPAAMEGSALVGLTDGAADEIVTLERRYLSPWQPLVITIRALNLASSSEIRELAQFSSATGWAVDNFEGITRHTPGHYFLVSDDNANPLQKTLLIYLALTLKR